MKLSFIYFIHAKSKCQKRHKKLKKSHKKGDNQAIVPIMIKL